MCTGAGARSSWTHSQSPWCHFSRAVSRECFLVSSHSGWFCSDKVYPNTAEWSGQTCVQEQGWIPGTCFSWPARRGSCSVAQMWDRHVPWTWSVRSDAQCCVSCLYPVFSSAPEFWFLPLPAYGTVSRSGLSSRPHVAASCDHRLLVPAQNYPSLTFWWPQICMLCDRVEPSGMIQTRHRSHSSGHLQEFLVAF